MKLISARGCGYSRKSKIPSAPASTDFGGWFLHWLSSCQDASILTTANSCHLDFAIIQVIDPWVLLSGRDSAVPDLLVAKHFSW